MDLIGYWIVRIDNAYDELDIVNMDTETRTRLIYAASRLCEELEKAASKTNNS